MGVTIIQVDAFSDRPFSGNPAGVCILSEPRPEKWMQDVACEMNLSETCYLVPVDGEAARFDLRWFTPAIEVDLCGHATLASAHVLWEQGRVAEGATIGFDTRSGRLEASRSGDWIELDFPSDPPVEAEAAPGLAEALGATLEWVGRSKLYDFVEVADEAALRSLDPDFAALREVVPVGVVVTCRSDSEEFDFVSRFFGPGAGIDEDPVTGSAHCLLSPFWRDRLDRNEMLAYQASARGGVVRVRDRGSRVLLGGHAVTVLRAELLV